MVGLRSGSWDKDITDAHYDEPGVAISRWSCDSVATTRFSLSSDHEIIEVSTTYDEKETRPEPRQSAQVPPLQLRGRQASTKSNWSTSTAAEDDAGQLTTTKSLRKKTKAIDTSFLTQDWEVLMRDFEFRKSIFFDHCRKNEAVALRYLLMTFPTDDFLHAKTKRKENGVALAAAHGSGDVLAYLVNKGADIDNVDKDGRTPIMLATISGHSVIVDFLLSHGADTSIQDRKGNTVMHHALPNISGAKNIRESLQKMGSDDDGERVDIAVRLLRYNLDHHQGEDHLGQKYSNKEEAFGDDDDERALLPKGNETPHPNGGGKAWLQVFGAFLIFFNTAGVSSSFGIYQSYYTHKLKLATSQASGIGSVQGFLILFTSLFCGPLYDAGLYKYLLGVGITLQALGTWSQSFSTQFWQFLLSQAFAIGMGGGMFNFIGPSILSTYFTTKLPMCSGVAALGGALAGIIYPILFRSLEPVVGFGWTIRVFAIIVTTSLITIFLIMRPRTQPSTLQKQQRSFLDRSAFRDWPYITFVLGNFMTNLGLYVPFNFLTTFALQRGLADESLAMYLITILNLGSLFGRLLPSLGATRVGPLNVICMAGIMTGLFASSLLFVNSIFSLLIVAVGYGFSTGAYFALQPVTLITLCPDPSRVGARVGMGSALLALGALPTTSVAGALQDTVGFTGVWLYAAICTGGGAALMTAARVQKVGLLVRRV